MLSVSSPNIVQAYGYFEKEDTIYMVLEFMAKGDLLSVLRNGDKNFKELCSLAIQCALPLVQIHANNLCHRDIAARNYLVSDENKVKLSDFGLAKHITDENYYGNESKEDQLPVRWCAPEVLVKRKFSTKSDVWSFGIVCFEIFSEGAVPFNELDAKQCKIQIGQDCHHPSRPEKCRPEFWSLILPCFANVADRPSIDAIFQPLENYWETNLGKKFSESKSELNSENSYVFVEPTSETKPAYAFIEPTSETKPESKDVEISSSAEEN